MAKPSIFSKDYEKRMRVRKKRIVFAVLILVVLVIFATIYIRGIFKNFTGNTNNVKSNVVSNKNETKDSNVTKQQTTTPNKEEKKEQQYNIQLSDGTNVNAVYETKNNEKTFKNVSPAESNVFYSISPNSKSMVLLDSKAQSIILLDIDGNKQDITNPKYVSTNGTEITKESQLSAQPDYMWCSSPRFVSDDKIAYISQLPWIGKNTKYIWTENIKDKTHSLIQGIEGEDIKFDKITDKGLTVIIDGKTMYLTSNDSISE
ncbi:hypothetical protein JMF89_05830 [Clostridiaceae bacterium UIB06]|uniref:tRNA (Guanine-N1)-methyltransferase n=1 Tax=Clostridium thailandense TaxID=2794346 RepID=A0A949TKR8_9CLOT|nr:hypothetical protein [Clostridium thailandense]MBV7272297.1 hypothetical protein [Clostridium thailandense]MCH5136741.1 hypothetical protein [Clostridiaceae bacterium UIB06]